LIEVNSLKENKYLMQRIEPHESPVVLNRLPNNTWYMGIQSFRFGYKLSEYERHRERF